MNAPRDGAGVEVALAACPFGCTDSPYIDPDGDEASEPRFWVECLKCGAKGPEWSCFDKAVTAWNTRLSTTTAREAEAARIERQLLAFVADDDDATTVPALQYVMNRSDRIAAALAHPTGDTGQGERESALEEAAQACHRVATESVCVLVEHDAQVQHRGIVAGAYACFDSIRALASTDQSARGEGA